LTRRQSVFEVAARLEVFEKEGLLISASLRRATRRERAVASTVLLRSSRID
jgi:hypothetical protein